MEEVIFRTTTLYAYAGDKHANCSNTNLIKVNCKFFQGLIAFHQEVGYCEKCKRYFILDTTRENLNKFCDYKVLWSDNLERITFDWRTNWTTREPCEIPNQPPRGVSEGWGITHPLQGGDCKGK